MVLPAAVTAPAFDAKEFYLFVPQPLDTMRSYPWHVSYSPVAFDAYICIVDAAVIVINVLSS